METQLKKNRRLLCIKLYSALFSTGVLMLLLVASPLSTNLFGQNAPVVKKEIDPKEKKAWEEIQELAKQKKFPEAIKFAMDYLQNGDTPEARGSVRIHFLLGKLFFATERYLEAREQFDYVLRVKLIHKESLDYDRQLRQLGQEKLSLWEKNKSNESEKMKAIQTLFMASRLNPLISAKVKQAIGEAVDFLMKNKAEARKDRNGEKRWLKMVAWFNLIQGRRKQAGEYYMQLLDLTTSNLEEFLIDNLLETLFKTKEEVFMDKLAKADPSDPDFSEALDEHTKDMKPEEKESFKEMVTTAKDFRSSLDGLTNAEDRKTAMAGKKKEILQRIESNQIKLPKAWRTKIDQMKKEGKSLDDLAGKFLGEGGGAEE